MPVVKAKYGATYADVAKVMELVSKRVRFIEIYQETASISANQQATLLSFQVPSGYAMEVFAVGIIPDYNPSTGVSDLQYVYFQEASKRAIPNLEFYANFYYNSLPYGNEACKQGMRQFDTPLKPNNLTLKFNEKETFQMIGVAGSTGAGAITAVAKAFLLEEADVQSIYGCGLKEFANLPGGHNNPDQNFLYAGRFTNANNTAGTGVWEDVAQLTVQPWQRLMFTHIGVKPGANSYKLKIFDEKTKLEFPDREPFWIIKETANTLPFGGQDSYQPVQPLPLPIAAYEWNDTVLHFYHADTGAAVSAGELKIQVFGIQRRVR